jgi:hypothetical protein
MTITEEDVSTTNAAAPRRLLESDREARGEQLHLKG